MPEPGVDTNAQPPAAPATMQPPSEGQPAPAQGGPSDLGDLNARYISAVAEKEARVFQLEQQLKSERKERETLAAERELWQKDPVAAFEKHGGSMDAYTQRLMNDGNPSTDEAVSGLTNKIAALEQKLARREETDKEREERFKQDQYFTSYAQDVSKLFDAEEYEPVRLARDLEKELFGQPYDLAAMVREPYQTQMKQTGKGLTPAESAAQILNNSQQLIEKLKNSQAIKKILGIQAEQSGGVSSQNQPSNVAQSRNLTNGMETSGGSSSPLRPDEMTDRQWAEHVARIAANK